MRYFPISARRFLVLPACLPAALLAACTLVALLIAGCSGRQSGAPKPEALSGNIQTYQLKGVVVSSDPKTGVVTINSETIPGFMDAMVMPYNLAQPTIAGELHPGDHVTARLEVSDSGSYRLDQIVVTAQANPSYKPSVVYNTPTAGQQVPDFHFLNQNGKTIDIAQFRGKVLLVTFIYTRCPLPDYCIRMTRNFAQINHALAQDPNLYRKTHLLSVSFDPDYDTPKVLRSYGASYIGKDAEASFPHWDFAAPPKAELQQVDQFFDVGVTPGADQTLTHSLSTVVISPEGKILSWYPTNEWKPEQLVQLVKDAAGAPPRPPSGSKQSGS